MTTAVTLHRLESLFDRVGVLEAVHARQAASEGLSRFVGDPVGFAREVLHVDRLSPTQVEHLELAVSERRVAAFGANGCGKTFDDAILALYLVYVERALVVATSAREGQLRDQFMRDVKLLFQQAPELDGELHTLALRRPAQAHAGIICVAAGETSRLRGFHAPLVVFLVEEAQGVADWVFDVAEMVAVGERDRVLLAGNCDMGPSGPFYRRCVTWPSVRFDATQHPNVLEGRTVIPGGPTRESIAQRGADYGEDSPFYLTSVLGLWAESSDDVLTTRALVWAAWERWRELQAMPRGGLPMLTLDPARKGPDSSVLAVAYEEGELVVLEELNVWNKLGAVDLASRVLGVMERLSLPRSHGVTVDEPGLGGGVCDVLEAMGVRVHEFNGGRPPSARGQAHFRNLRAESYWNIRVRLARGTIALPADDLLADELVATRWSTGVMDGRVEIENKDVLRLRLGRSPDRADALAMVCWADNRVPLLV